MSSSLVAAFALSVCGFLVVAAHHATVPELIRWNGYPCEEHFVTTKDGYILALHRIPYGKNGERKGRTKRPPVMMQHGLLSSSASWTLNVTHKAPAYLIADAGYDVWLTNIRGSSYSKNHTKLNPKSKKFWQFSWDEMAIYDVPAFIDYILKKTKRKKLYYIGHSMGTTMFFAAMNLNPKYNHKIKAMYALAPVGTVRFVDTWFIYFSYMQREIAAVLRTLGDYEIVPHSSAIMKVTRRFCNKFKVTNYICENLLFLFVGFDKSEFDPSWMPTILDELLSGTSLNTLLHYSQEYRAGRFQRYDYGMLWNYLKYRQIAPPEYDLKFVTAPVHLIWGMNDYLADDKDVQFLIEKLPNVRSKCPVPFKKFSHLDFLWAKDSKELIYDPLLKLMKKDLYS